MQEPLQDIPMMLGVYVLLRRILLASQMSTPSDIGLTTLMKRFDYIIFRVDIMMVRVVGLSTKTQLRKYRSWHQMLSRQTCILIAQIHLQTCVTKADFMA